MSEERPRRRLTLMPEVLPKPRQLLPTSGRTLAGELGAAPASAARARTVEHMKRLVAGVTSTVALVGCSDGANNTEAGSSKPADKTTATATATAAVSATATATATASIDPTTSATGSATDSAVASQTIKKPVIPPRPPTGYMVVDPMPMPPPRKK